MSHPFSMIALPGFTFIFIALFLFYIHHNRQSTKPLQPGPPRPPIIGNLHQAPTKYPWKVYQDWSKEYGPIFSLQFGLHTIIILENHETAHAMLNKHSDIYSSRPGVPMAADCVGKGLLTLLMPYGPRWRNHHKMQTTYLNARISQTYTAIQDMESKQLVFDFGARLHRYASSLIFDLAYGKRLPCGDEPELKAVEKIMKNFLVAAQVGTWIVDAIPQLNYLPNWLAPWKRYGDELYEFERKAHKENFEQAENNSSWNWCKEILKSPEGKGMSKMELTYKVGIIYEGRSDTTTMTLEVFVLAAVLYPVVKKAQSELDAAVGPHRLPLFEDKPNLPYIHAIIQEVLRWRPISAGGIPHAVTEDDEYLGYHIPKGATVIANLWGICHDGKLFNDPDDFVLERWIENRNLLIAAFGHGRRACTGQHIARNSLFINIARLLWGFDIGHGFEERDGKRVRIEVDRHAMTQGLNSRPMPLGLSSRRGVKKRKLI